VIENHRLLGAGIERLLRREADLQVVGATPENQGALLQAIGHTRADVVILDASATDAAGLLALLELYPGLRLVLVRVDDGLVRTYEARQVIVTQATELVNLVRS